MRPSFGAATRAWSVPLLAALLTALSAACGDADAAGVIDREAFIATWVELRRAGIRTGDPLPERERTRVLEERGVTEEELLAFAEAHGADPRYMAEVWTEIENRMRPAPPADSATSGTQP